MFVNRLKFVLFLVLICSLYSSCGIIVKAKARSAITIEKGAIPADFCSNGETVIFILYNRGSYDNGLKRNVKNNYSGNAVFVTRSEMDNNSTYADKETYRYIFDYDYHTYTYMAQDFNGGISQMRTGRVKEFFIYDRLTNRHYKSNFTSAYFGKVQKVYLRKLNAMLLAQHE